MTNSDAHLLLDASTSMRYGKTDPFGSKMEYAEYLAAGQQAQHHRHHRQPVENGPMVFRGEVCVGRAEGEGRR